MDEFSKRSLDRRDDRILDGRVDAARAAMARASRAQLLFAANGLPVPFDLLPEPEGDPGPERLLELARADYADREYYGVLALASGVLRAPDATAEQRAEALRLRALANSWVGFDDDAIDDARKALELVPFSTDRPASTALVRLHFGDDLELLRP